MSSLLAAHEAKPPVSASALPISTAFCTMAPPTDAGSVTAALIGRFWSSSVRKRPMVS